ncbi:MAG: carbamoyltransferase HypF [Gammaproteobacteria bacterium]|nr:carbamoyltransferase HypF [Gammaproteobacteria bacterium]
MTFLTDVLVTGGIVAKEFVITGHVQAVGYRPFIYRLAHRLAINGWVENRMGQVVIHAEANQQQLDDFQTALIHEAPATARVNIQQVKLVDTRPFADFTIRKSSSDGHEDIRILDDLAVCDDCLAELNDTKSRYYQYPFIACTQCGPRYTVIKHLPYDRVNTSLNSFKLCHACRADYSNPEDRRFHAEAMACAACGPELHFHNKGRIYKSVKALARCVEALQQGLIVAVKGVGGYHLMCDARRDDVVNRLRLRKHRPDKPLAVMLSSTQSSPLNQVIVNDETINTLLDSPVHPLVLIQKPEDSGLAENISPGLDEIGILRPYSPIHHLLIDACGFPLVATSANNSGEPVLTDDRDVEQRLSSIADAFLHHNRPIERPADDPVYRVIHHKPRALRLGRGNAPLEMDLPFSLSRPVLAVGGHMKNSIALAWDNRIVISPHIGDLASLRSQQVFTRVINDIQTLYHTRAERIICDANSSYASSRWARQQALPLTKVFHHHAHAAILAGEYPDIKNWLVFTWDGVGLGEDKTLWGGEALLGNAGHWQRAASMMPFYLPGADKASREPWRSAAALCWQTGTECKQVDAIEGSDLLHQAWQKRLNTHKSSAVGRLFDAAAALINSTNYISYEGQAAMQLEAIAGTGQAEAIALPLYTDEQGCSRTDWTPLLQALMNTSISKQDRAALFHSSLAQSLVAQAIKIREQQGEFSVGLSGGVFQNRILTGLVMDGLSRAGFNACLPGTVPLNDAGLCYGQVIESANI